jgi:hypothetical protein
VARVPGFILQLFVGGLIKLNLRPYHDGIVQSLNHQSSWPI